MLDKKNKILIIGKNSFVASHFIKFCEKNKVDHYTCSHYNIPLSFDKYDCVVNFTINPKFFTHEYTLTIDQDALIAKKVSDYKNLRYVMVSSRLVYGFKDSLINISEDHKLNIKNNSLYGVNKVLSEEYCRSILKPNNLLIARGSNLFGYEINRRSFLGIALKRLLEKSEILLDISKKTIRDFIPVNDFANFLAVLITKNCSGIFNVSSGIGIKLEDLCNTIIRGYGEGILVTTLNAPIKDQFILNNSKLVNVTKREIKKLEIMNYAKDIGKKLKLETKVNLDNV